MSGKRRGAATGPGRRSLGVGGWPKTTEAKSTEGGSVTQTKVRPVYDRILVKRIEEQEVKKGGIIIPDTAKEKPQEGEVVAVGNGKILDDGTRVVLEVKAGSRILFGKYSGTEVKIDEQEYLIMREDDVLAIVG